jgi:flagellar basal-body rod modification protein FlgD
MDTGLINSISAGSSTTTTKTPTKELDKDAFMMLLVAQLQHQDPTQAQDSNAMMQQMTSFSSLEQMQNTNKLLEGIQLQNQGLFQAQSSSLVGKRIRVTSSGFDLKEGKATMGVDLASDAIVSISIKDAAGKVVTTLDKGSMSAGSHMLDWDGRDAQGNKLADGAYTVEINAKDSTGKTVSAAPSAYMTVTSVLFANGTVFIQAGGRRFTLTDVNEISA